MSYILVVLYISLSFNSSIVIYQDKKRVPGQDVYGSEVHSKVFLSKDLNEVTRKIKECEEERTCGVVELIGCDLLGCKEYDHSLTTEPEIKDKLILREK